MTTNTQLDLPSATDAELDAAIATLRGWTIDGSLREGSAVDPSGAVWTIPRISTGWWTAGPEFDAMKPRGADICSRINDCAYRVLWCPVNGRFNHTRWCPTATRAIAEAVYMQSMENGASDERN